MHKHVIVTKSALKETVELSCQLCLPDTTGVLFDTHSKMAMSQGGTAERMKEKVSCNYTVHVIGTNISTVLLDSDIQLCCFPVSLFGDS